MIKRIHKLVASSISEIDYPKIAKFQTWLILPHTKEAKNFLNIRFRLNKALVSENISLRMPEARQISSIIHKQEATGGKLIFSGPEFEPKIDSLLFPPILPQNGDSSINHLIQVPDIIDLHTLNRIEIESFLVFENTGFDCVETFEIDILAVVQIEVSANLFHPIGKRNPEGKVFDTRQTEQDLFEEKKPATDEVDGVRKAYKVKKGKYSTSVRKLTVWDLLYPLLLPPLSFDFKEQFDFYRPLYGYQQKGVEFLVDHTAALLADEMGTGKTVQTIIALRILFRQAKVQNALIVCPVAVIGSARLSSITGKSEGWDGHFYNWAPEPELSVTVVRGNQNQRKLDWEYPSHIYITTYETIRNDFKNGLLTEKKLNKFDCVVLDEAQKIKNRNSGISRSIRKIKTQYRWALTGTPIENTVDDVISIFDFVKPKHFDHKKSYGHTELMNHMAPYFLRRLKRDVLKDLPKKLRQEIWLDLDADQQVEYDAILNGGRSHLAETVKSENAGQVRVHIFSLLTKLKQVCNFAPKKHSSPKTDLLLDFIDIISANDEKVLVFCYYIDYGIERLEKIFEKSKVKHVTYKGGMTTVQKQRAIRDFRTQKDIHVFLCSVKAGGVGMNLAEASYVIHFDHWWNPAVMWQAEDRAHRHSDTGKKKGVKKLKRTDTGEFVETDEVCLNVYSFWIRNTIEERIKRKLKEKGLLIENVIDSLAEEAIDETITTDEWLEILGVEKKTEDKTKRIKTIHDAMDELRRFNPDDFEIITKDFFIRLGYTNARVTKKSHDGGIDVFGSRKTDTINETIVAQCKRTETVGVKVARELFGVMASRPNVQKGFIVTTGSFTEECRRFSVQNPKLNLIDGPQFANYLIQFKLI